MASLESIRKRSGLLIGIVGLALLAFLLGDFLGSGNKILGNQQRILGEVNGQAIDQQQFEIELKNISDANPNARENSQLREQLWTDKVNAILLQEEYETSGLGMTSEELSSITLGANGIEMSDIARSIFGIQPGQEVPTAQLSQSIAQLQQENPTQWNYIEDIIRKQYLNTKFNTLVQKSYYATGSEAKEYFEQQGKTASGKYIYKAYSSIFDEDVTVTDEDIRAVYNKNIKDYDREEEREVKFAVFDIKASAEDIEQTRTRMTNLLDQQVSYNETYKVYDTIPGFRTAEDVQDFLIENSDDTYNAAYFAKGQLSASIDDAMHNAEIGAVVGPYFEGDQFKTARLMDKRNDSVQVAIFTMDVLISDKTTREIFTKAGKFSMDNNTEADFDAKADADQSISVNGMILNEQSRSLTGVGEARRIVSWSFNDERKVGDLNRFDLGDKYVVAMLVNKYEKGKRSFEELKEQLRPAAIREKKKEMLISEFNGKKGASFDATATAIGITAVDFSSVPFSSSSLTGVGYEPKVIGAMFGLEPGSVSEPIAGNAGVFVLQLGEFTETAESNSYEAIQAQLQGTFQYRTQEVLPALKDAAEIEDNRIKFF